MAVATSPHVERQDESAESKATTTTTTAAGAAATENNEKSKLEFLSSEMTSVRKFSSAPPVCSP
ncbi:hypothetical protein RUM43_008915 [Polyplax serrata]|uniref:Uncharacterized protein n=1 Tax=Polyplax serrata TaxID=468196 RepID=A0AAN8PH49_POLSC